MSQIFILMGQDSWDFVGAGSEGKAMLLLTKQETATTWW